MTPWTGSSHLPGIGSQFTTDSLLYHKNIYFVVLHSWLLTPSTWKLWKQWQTLFSRAPKSLWMVTSAMKLKGGKEADRGWDGDGITDSMDLSVSKLREVVKDREALMQKSTGSQRVKHDWATEQQHAGRSTCFFLSGDFNLRSYGLLLNLKGIFEGNPVYFPTHLDGYVSWPN